MSWAGETPAEKRRRLESLLSEHEVELGEALARLAEASDDVQTRRAAIAVVRRWLSELPEGS